MFGGRTSMNWRVRADFLSASLNVIVLRSSSTFACPHLSLWNSPPRSISPRTHLRQNHQSAFLDLPRGLRRCPDCSALNVLISLPCLSASVFIHTHGCCSCVHM
ncbi:hypothetical protein TGPRC2_426280 [Toxoplasma gondii TgCatPRC2]|uniref:Uncharacterized protein n=1 Tax=Toxoplasma gondii TgCatPRC2 TaxID=1130821 RepID=A0A151H5B7_TOXGO|nr:hypothetical protein TGPRC2_426280 [Toxoplasma gondii TgCatPRC2]